MPRSTAQLQPISEVWEWQLLGRCRDRSGAQFFHPDDDLGRISRRLREAAAKRLCHSCPVRPQCAAHALEVGEEYGVWGGFSENDRGLLRDVGWRDAVDGAPSGRREQARPSPERCPGEGRPVGPGARSARSGRLAQRGTVASGVAVS